MSETHREVQVRSPGGHDRLALVDRPRRELEPGELRIEVAAAGVNYADCCLRMGLYSAVSEYPMTPGFEVSGWVSELGSEVSGFSLGQQVLAVTRFGGYTEELVVPAAQVFPLPSRLSLEQGAGFAATHLTAWHALVDLAHVQEGETVLIHSAAGGVGTAACGLAQALGAKVIGVVGSEDKVDLARRHGAGAVIDKSRGRLWSELERLAPDGCDVVLDGNGVETLKQSFEHLAPSGRLLIHGFATMLPRGKDQPSRLALAWHWLRTPRFDPFRMVSENKAVLGFNVVYQFDRIRHFRAALDELFGWLEEGRLLPPQVTSVPFETPGEAHRRLESGASRGKIVLGLSRKP